MLQGSIIISHLSSPFDRFLSTMSSREFQKVYISHTGSPSNLLYNNNVVVSQWQFLGSITISYLSKYSFRLRLERERQMQFIEPTNQHVLFKRLPGQTSRGPNYSDSAIKSLIHKSRRPCRRHFQNIIRISIRFKLNLSFEKSYLIVAIDRDLSPAFIHLK